MVDVLLWGVTALLALDALVLTYVNWKSSQLSTQVIKAVLSLHFAIAAGIFLVDGIAGPSAPSVLVGASSMMGATLLWIWPGVIIESRKDNRWRSLIGTAVALPLLLVAAWLVVELSGDATEGLFTVLGAFVLFVGLIGLLFAIRERWRLAH